MKNILFIHGSLRKGETIDIVQLFINELKKFTELKEEHLYLVDENLESCRACFNCFKYGEEKCPINDDFIKIYKLMLNADAIVFTTPVYALQVSNLMKKLFERLAFVFHRPCFFGKFAIPIVTQGITGHKKVLEYVDTVVNIWGFKTVKGVALTLPNGFRSKKQKATVEEEVKKGALRFFKAISLNEPKKVRLPGLIYFRITRSMMSASSKMDDYFAELAPSVLMYYKEKGWLTSDFYYDVKLNIFQRIIGKYFDSVGKKIAKKMIKEMMEEETKIKI